MRLTALRKRLTIWVLAIVSIFAFSGCSNKEIIAPPSSCPQFEIYDLPAKVDLSEVKLIGRTNIHFDYNRTTTDVFVGVKGSTFKYLDYSILSAVISPDGVIYDTIDYTANMRTKLEKYKSALEIHQDKNNTKINQ